MPDSELNPVVRNFKINVTKNGVFSYDPPGTWLYGRGDFVRFNSDTGPFEIRFVPQGGKSLPGGPTPFAGVKEDGLRSSDTAPFETALYSVPVPDQTNPAVKLSPVNCKYKITMTRSGQVFDNNSDHDGGIQC